MVYFNRTDSGENQEAPIVDQFVLEQTLIETLTYIGQVIYLKYFNNKINHAINK